MLGVLSILKAPIAQCAADAIEVVRSAEKALRAEIHVGQVLVIKTAPAPVTAYRWEVISPSQPQIERVLPRCGRPNDEKPLLGGDEIGCFSFIGRAPGTATVHFAFFAGHSYPGSDLTDQFCVTVSVVE